MLINLAAPNHIPKPSRQSLRSPEGYLAFQKPAAPDSRRFNHFEQVLPFNQLAPYEPVSDQFTAWGIEFAGAIALYPSNPSFIGAPSDLVVMPMASTLQIKLLRSLPAVGLRLRGHQDIRVKTLDARGNIVPCKKTFYHRHAEAAKAPQETLALNLHRIRTLILTSSAPFVLESLSV